MAEKRYIRGRALRVTKLDGCGEPVLGPDSVVATKGFISVALTPNTQAGTAIQQENAYGELIIDETPTPKFRSWNLEFSFIGVNPSLLALMTGQPVVLNAAGDEIIGFKVNSQVDVDLVGFATELWTGVSTVLCTDGETQYGYMLIPFAKGGVIGGVTVENAAINFSVTGAVSKDGTGWGVGPYDVMEDETGLPGPLLEALDDGDHFYSITTAVAPPSDLDGDPQALGVPATGATAGTPGATTPANSYAPLNVAELIAGAGGDHGVAVVASPLTAWTTGQRIVLRDGSTAHWDSAAWVAGPA